MRDFGWLEGKNGEYRFVYPDGAVDRLDALAGELIGQNVEVIIVGNPALVISRPATTPIPQRVKTNLVESSTTPP